MMDSKWWFGSVRFRMGEVTRERRVQKMQKKKEISKICPT